MEALTRSALVFLGAGIGANARFWIQSAVQARISSSFPWGTIIVNVSGSLIIGAFMAWFLKGEMSMNWRLFVASGILGGYTTFSSFSYETVTLWNQGHVAAALGNIALSNVASIGACAAGFALVRAVI